MTAQQRKQLVRIRATARREKGSDIGAACQFMDANFKNKIIGGLWHAGVPQPHLRDAYNDVLERAGLRIYQLRNVKRFPGWLRRIENETAKKYRLPYVEAADQSTDPQDLPPRPKQIGTKWITIDGKQHEVKVFEPAPQVEEQPQRQLRFVEVSDSNLYRSSTRPDYGRGIDIRQALEKLPTRWALAIRLVYFEGRSRSEVADIMECSRTRIFKLLQKGKNRLREFLAMYGSRPEPNSTLSIANLRRVA